MNKDLFPKIKKKIENLIEDEEGSVPSNRIMMIGALLLIFGSMMSSEAFARHSSHVSHGSHDSHTSSSHGNLHNNHGSHESHDSHISHNSHTSHLNTASHSNSMYSAEGDVTYSAPSVDKVPGVVVEPITIETETFELPVIKDVIEVPAGTVNASIVPAIAVPSAASGTQMDTSDIHIPSDTSALE